MQMYSRACRLVIFLALFFAYFSLCRPLFAQSVEYLPGIEWPQPEVVTPGDPLTNPPSDAVVLFDGSDLSAWENGESWRIENGELIVGSGVIRTKEAFGDYQLHLEWSAPVPAKGRGQGRGNSGVFLAENYEVQILDSFENETYHDGQAAAIYKQMPPMVNAMRPPGEWNVYDIVWTAPRFAEDDSLESPAYVTVFHNGVLVQYHFELKGGTYWENPPEYEPHPVKMPITLQDHGNPVRFRNIWLREFAPIQGKQARKPRYVDHATGKRWLASEAGNEGPPDDEIVEDNHSAEDSND